jgi:hypothetical protein
MSIAVGTSRRHLIRRGGLICLWVRHSTNLVVALLAGIDSHLVERPAGRLLLAALGCWAVYRLATRSLLWQFTAADFAWTIAVACGVELIVSSADFYTAINVPEVIIGVAAGTLVIQAPPVVSLPMSLATASSTCSRAGRRPCSSG